MSTKEPKEGSLAMYISGFVLSVALTLTAYFMVVNSNLAVGVITVAILIMAVTQFLVQMYFFLHLGQETGPRWKLSLAALMIVLVLILVVGTIWIMNNLNYRMSPEQINTYLNNQGGGF